MTDRLRRTGLVLAHELMSSSQRIELARRAETLGYEVLWVGETWVFDSLPILAELALNTSRVQLGTSVISIFSRTPGMLAQGIATLDDISQGRSILGLGPSSRTLVEGWHGVPFDRPIARMRELVPLLRQILSGERVSFEGTFYRMEGLKLPRPPRRDIPIYLAALSRRHLELTGELADGWLPTFFAPDRLEEFRTHMRRGAASVGRELARVTLAPWILTCVSEDPEQARELARQHIGFFVAAYGDAYRKLVRRYGFDEEVDRLLELWQTDRKALTSGVSDALLNAIAITGTPAQCRERFEMLYDQGIDLPAVLVPSQAPMDVYLETLEALAPASR
jgi:probable F420-dependent oxidoreductase